MAKKRQRVDYRQALEAAKRASVAQLLFRAARLLNERAIARLRAKTRLGNVRTSHTALLPHIDLDGTRLTELARRMDVSKQAAAELVDELEAMGVLEKVPDPSDGRAKLVRFTKRGRQGLLDGLRLLQELETELESALGRDRLRALHATLVALVDELEADRG
jgi:DNA-binding MarR family transcriptional regulator